MNVSIEVKSLTEISESSKEIAAQLKVLNESIKSLVDILTPQKAAGIRFYAEIEGIMRRVVQMFLKVNQSLPLSLKIADKFGNPAKVDGVPQWALSDATLGTLTPSEDGMTATLVPAGPIGASKVQVSCDADLGEGVKSIIGELDVEFMAGEAEVVAITAGEAV